MDKQDERDGINQILFILCIDVKDEMGTHEGEIQD